LKKNQGEKQVIAEAPASRASSKIQNPSRVFWAKSVPVKGKISMTRRQ